MEGFLEDVISGYLEEYGMEGNERKSIWSAWQHGAWHKGKA